jgi:hypothetical protein
MEGRADSKGSAIFFVYILRRELSIVRANSSSFFTSAERVCAEDYIPTDEDILKLRVVTQSVSDNVFDIKPKRIHLIDVSGLKYHRFHWLKWFDNVHCVLFVVSLSCYDQMMIEDSTINRMADSIVLFEQVANHPMLKNSKIILFMNKKDVYEKKVKKIPIKGFFPEFEGFCGSFRKGYQCIPRC